MKYKNTIVTEFDDLKDSKREELLMLLTEGLLDGWVTHLSAEDDVERLSKRLGEGGVENE